MADPDSNTCRRLSRLRIDISREIGGGVSACQSALLYQLWPVDLAEGWLDGSSSIAARPRQKKLHGEGMGLCKRRRLGSERGFNEGSVAWGSDVEESGDVG